MQDSNQPSPLEPQSTIPPLTPSPRPSRAKWIALSAAVALLLVIGGVVAALMVSSSNTSNSNKNDSAASISPSQKEAITIDSRDQLEEVCNGKKISNSPAVEGNKFGVVGFVTRNDGDTWAMFATSSKPNNYAYDITATNVVECVVPDESTYTAAKTCNPTDFTTQQKVEVEYIAATYSITFYAAQTGEVLSQSSVTTSNETCPEITTSASITDGKIYVTPDSEQLNKVFDEFLAAQAT